MPPQLAEVTWCDQRLLLTGERAVVWPAQRTVLVADVHLGKEAVFRRHGMAVPDGPTVENLDRLTAIVRRHSCERVVVLGDLMHAPPRAGDTWPRSVSRWLDDHRQLAVHVVAGNHDRAVGRQRLDARIQWHLASLPVGPFQLRHEPAADGDEGFAICGHLHPVIRLRIGAERLRAPVFWWRRNSAVLPAFGRFTGGHPISTQSDDRIWVVQDGAVVEFPAAGALSKT